MEKKRLVILLVFVVGFLTASEGQSLRVATFNMRYDNLGDSLNPWSERLPVIIQMVRFHDFDIFGGQELLHNQVKGLEHHLPGFTWHGAGRDDGREAGEYSPIFFKKDKFRLLHKGTFWLSESPDKPGKGWDASLPRVCSWVELEEIGTGYEFFVFNTHFDHRGQLARKNSTKLIIDQIRKLSADKPVILTGDFNFDQRHDNYGIIDSSGFLKDCYNLGEIKMTHNGTSNGFKITAASDRRIDHIFVNEFFKVKRYGVLTDSYYGKFPSDHFPVMVEVSIK